LADTTPPTLTSLSLPTNVNLSVANPTATFTVDATDDLSGVNSVVIFLDRGLSITQFGNTSVQQGFLLQQNPDGSFSTTLDLSPNTSAGTYHITDIQVQDKSGNLHDYQASNLTALGIGTSFNFTGGDNRHDPSNADQPELTDQRQFERG
jgi:hypothetical protein